MVDHPVGLGRVYGQDGVHLRQDFPLQQLIAVHRSAEAIRTGAPKRGASGAEERGLMWVVMTTSPSSMSPWTRISSIFSAVERATIAPSASEIMPTIWGLAPREPSLPTTPIVGAAPPPRFPLTPGTETVMKSVEPPSPWMVSISHSFHPRAVRASATTRPLTFALSRSSITSRTCLKDISQLSGMRSSVDSGLSILVQPICSVNQERGCDVDPFNGRRTGRGSANRLRSYTVVSGSMNKYTGCHDSCGSDTLPAVNQIAGCTETGVRPLGSVAVTV